MDILLISGFLGAGKTSFIKGMTRATGRQFVVVENEFGELNLDGDILRRDAPVAGDAPEMKIWELTEGCICCSMNVDFSLSVLTIANALRPDYLLVEPSGVALPGRVLDGLRRITYEDIGLLAPVTIVDAAHFRVSRRDYGEYFEDQVRTAGTVVLSKSEGMSEADFAEIERELDLTPGTAFPHLHYSKWPREMWFELLSRRLDAAGVPAMEPAPPPKRALTHRALHELGCAVPPELLDPAPEDRAAALRRLGRRAMETQGERQAVVLLKRLMGGVLRGMPGASALRRRAGGATGLEELLAVLAGEGAAPLTPRD